MASLTVRCTVYLSYSLHYIALNIHLVVWDGARLSYWFYNCLNIDANEPLRLGNKRCAISINNISLSFTRKHLCPGIGGFVGQLRVQSSLMMWSEFTSCLTSIIASPEYLAVHYSEWTVSTVKRRYDTTGSLCQFLIRNCNARLNLSIWRACWKQHIACCSR